MPDASLRKAANRVAAVLLAVPDGLPAGILQRQARVYSAAMHKALRGMEDCGWVTGPFRRDGETGPERRWYSLTPEGRAEVARLLGTENTDG